MPRQIAYVPQTGPLQNCLSVIVGVRSNRIVEIECTQLKEKGKRDVLSLDSLKEAYSWGWTQGNLGLNSTQVIHQLSKG